MQKCNPSETNRIKNLRDSDKEFCKTLRTNSLGARYFEKNFFSEKFEMQRTLFNLKDNLLKQVNFLFVFRSTD